MLSPIGLCFNQAAYIDPRITLVDAQSGILKNRKSTSWKHVCKSILQLLNVKREELLTLFRC